MERIFLNRISVAAATFILAGTANAQNLQQGIASADSHKYAAAKENYKAMIQQNPKDGSNYFYLGNIFLLQTDPNFEEASKYFNEGLAVDSRSTLNKIGLATVKLGKGDKSAVSEITNLVAKSKDSEELYRAAQALTLFEKNNAPDAAIDLLNRAIERSGKSGVPAYYYYSLGDAYRLKKDPGQAMTAYDKALPLAKNKASVYTRMATLWMAAQQYQQAEANIKKAIQADPTYAPAYMAQANYNYKFQKPDAMTQDLLNYTKYADEDPYTILEIAKLYFSNADYSNAKQTLDKVFDKVDDPIKYKLRAYIQYSADRDYSSAKQNLDTFMTTVKDKSRIQPADRGLEGLLIAALAKDEKDSAKKSSLMQEARQKVDIAKNAQDETLDWNREFAFQSGSVGAEATASSGEVAGPTNPKIESLKKKVAANPNDSNLLVELGTAYQEANNWKGALSTWQKMAQLVPDWEYSYYGQGVAYQQLNNEEMAKQSYQKYIDTLTKKPAAEQEANKTTLSYAYYLTAYFSQQSDPAKAKEYAQKAVDLNPGYEDAAKLNKALNK